MNDAATKTCPFCAEDILAAAVVCKHCRRDLPRPAPVFAPYKPGPIERAAPWAFGGLMAVMAILAVPMFIESARSGASPGGDPTGPQPLAYSTEAAIPEFIPNAAGAEALKQGRAHPPALGAGPMLVTVKVEMRDAYGNARTAPLATFHWPEATLQAVNWQGIADYQLVDLADHATMQLDDDGLRGLGIWCRERRIMTPKLCAEVKRRQRGH